MDIEKDSDVGIGVVYEQFRLNRLLEKIIKKYKIKTVLESPIYGMAGLTGINSMAAVDFDVRVTLADKKDYTEVAKVAWANAKRNAAFLEIKTENLPFKNQEFDFAYNFAALWHLERPGRMIDELCRVSKIVMICMPNPWNPLFQIRNLFGMLPKKQKKWADEKMIIEQLNRNGFKMLESGVVDIPPWPDTVIPVKEVFSWLGFGKGTAWRWSMLDYYTGKKEIEEKIRRYYFLEDSKLPNFIKKFWAHHFYIIAISSRL
jgi:hypothetical protein